jgi:hypothetical protein
MIMGQKLMGMKSAFTQGAKVGIAMRISIVEKENNIMKFPELILVFIIIRPVLSRKIRQTIKQTKPCKKFP